MNRSDNAINKHHRHSWGSGHSHSSSSLQSSAALGSSSKDDLWDVIQTNYNYIMDTNLLDTCKEASCEIDGAQTVIESPIKCFKMLDDNNQNKCADKDPKEVQDWLLRMEGRLGAAPTLSEATTLSIPELQQHLAQHSVLYHEIVSYARVVSSCVRVASEKEQQRVHHHKKIAREQNFLVDESSSNLSRINSKGQSLSNAASYSSVNSVTDTKSLDGPLEDKASFSLSTSSQPATVYRSSSTSVLDSSKLRSRRDLERLQTRYHLLYLKAFEIQLWLDGLLRKRRSSTLFPSSVSDTGVNDGDVRHLLNETLTEGVNLLSVDEFDATHDNTDSITVNKESKVDSKDCLLDGDVYLENDKKSSDAAVEHTIGDQYMTHAKSLSHESIRKLVQKAEHLVLDELLKTPKRQNHSIAQISSKGRKHDGVIMGPVNQRVQEWLEHQPLNSDQLQKWHDMDTIADRHINQNDDCEASAETSEVDSIIHLDSDTSEGCTESIATCMQTSTASLGNFTDQTSDIYNQIDCTGTVLSQDNKSENTIAVDNRPQVLCGSDRPLSISCISQLSKESSETSKNEANPNAVDVNLSQHTMSELASDSFSRTCAPSTASTHTKVDESKSLPKRRRTRKKKHSIEKQSNSGSEDTIGFPKLKLEQSVHQLDVITSQEKNEIRNALLSLRRYSSSPTVEKPANADHSQLPETMKKRASLSESEEEAELMKPNFRVGSSITTYMTSDTVLGSLARMATYINDNQGEFTIVTEDHHSSFSETAWDNYQEKYNSENYSEGFDSDAARQLLEFGDDYRNFIDSQSDCCSSVSAANNMDSFSPPCMDSQQKNHLKVAKEDANSSNADNPHHRCAVGSKCDRRRKLRQGLLNDYIKLHKSKNLPPGSDNTLLNQELINKLKCQMEDNGSSKINAKRKLELGSNPSVQPVRRSTESENASIRRRKIDERRRSSRNVEKTLKLFQPITSSSGEDSDEEKEMRNLLQLSQNRFDETQALKIRCHLLRPEDYLEIISICRDNIHCLESVLQGPHGTVLSTQCFADTKDLLAGWRSLLEWSERTGAAKSMLEEITVLKSAVQLLGKSSDVEILDTRLSIQMSIEALQNDKLKLQNYRKSMLRVNASVHSWLIRQERKTVENPADHGSGQILANDMEAETSRCLNEEENDRSKQQMEAAASAISDPLKRTGKVSCANAVHAAVDNMDGEAIAMFSPLPKVATASQRDKACPKDELQNHDSQEKDTQNKFMTDLENNLRDEVSEMYSAWDEAAVRVESRLDVLTSSLQAWEQLEAGLKELQLSLGQDNGTLKNLKTVLERGDATQTEMAKNIMLLANLLSEKKNLSQGELNAVNEYLNFNKIAHLAQLKASNGSLSDSGISDGGTISDSGISERERRLTELRRLANQLKAALAPGSEAMKSIDSRMKSVETELKSLQNTCRDLIIRTAVHHQSEIQQQQCNKSSTSRRANKDHSPAERGDIIRKRNCSDESKGLRQRNSPSKSSVECSKPLKSSSDNGGVAPALHGSEQATERMADADGGCSRRSRWAWRVFKIMLPLQLAVFGFLCCSCVMEPNCCEYLNTLSTSFTTQLRYLRGPPPI